MTTPLQYELQWMRESKLVEEFKKSLTGFDFFSFLQTSDFASSLAQAITDANKMETPRQGEIACSEKQENIFAWVERMFVDSGVGTERFYLSTAFSFFRWLDCKVVSSEWVKNLNDVRDLNFSAISYDKKIFLSIANEKYYVDAYWCNLQ